MANKVSVIINRKIRKSVAVLLNVDEASLLPFNMTPQSKRGLVQNLEEKFDQFLTTITNPAVVIAFRKSVSSAKWGDFLENPNMAVSTNPILRRFLPVFLNAPEEEFYTASAAKIACFGRSNWPNKLATKFPDLLASLREEYAKHSGISYSEPETIYAWIIDEMARKRGCSRHTAEQNLQNLLSDKLHPESSMYRRSINILGIIAGNPLRVGSEVLNSTPRAAVP